MNEMIMHLIFIFHFKCYFLTQDLTLKIIRIQFNFPTSFKWKVLTQKSFVLKWVNLFLKSLKAGFYYII
jgi:hypothetical protein